MGDSKPTDTVGDVSHAYGGSHYFIRTSLELKGRGVKYVESLSAYKVTNRAMDILAENHEFAMELLLD